MAEEVAADGGCSIDRCLHTHGALVGCEGGSTILGGSVGALGSDGVSTLFGKGSGDGGIAVYGCQVDCFDG